MEEQKKDYWTGPQFSAVHKDWEMPFLALRKLPLIIGVVGPSRVGKTMVARRWVTEQGFHYEKTSSVIRRHLKLMGKTKSRRSNESDNIHWRDINEFAEKLREMRGPDIVARTILKNIDPLMKNNNRFVIDGLIHPEDVELVMRRENVVLVGMVASQAVRAREASHWFLKTYDEMMQELTERDKYENYDHDLIEEYIADDDAGPDSMGRFIIGNPKKPDVLACFQKVDKRNIIRIGKNTRVDRNKAFTSQIFNRADDILARILRDSII